MEEHSITQAIKPRAWDTVRVTVFVLVALLLFLFALDLMISSFQLLDPGLTTNIIQSTSNPMTAMCIGLLITAMMQSSSVTTALAVAMVGAGSLTLQSALFIIMGANVGTTITSTIVSLGYFNRKKELKRAVSAGTYHCFFNLLTLIVLFPLEYNYRFLSSLSHWISAKFYAGESIEEQTARVKSWLDPFVAYLVELVPAVVILVIGFFLVLGSILLFRKYISELLNARSPQTFGRFFFQNPGKSFVWGILTTAAIRSSTITTSVVVPIVARKITGIRQAAPFIMGANIGTTITAFIAVFLYSNNNNAISIAIAHFLFNLIGVLLFFPIPALKELPIQLSQGLGKATVQHRAVGFIFLFLTFFFIPFLTIFLTQ